MDRITPTQTWEDCLKQDALRFSKCRLERSPRDGKYRVFATSCFLYPLAVFSNYAAARDYVETKGLDQ